MRSACDACRTPLDPPDAGPARIGRVVLVGNRLLVRHAVAVAQRRGAVLVLDRTDDPTPLETDRFDGLARVPLPHEDALGAAGRLWVAGRARVDGSLKARWSDAAVRAAAVRTATASVGARRGAALDLVTLGLPDEPGLRLTASELTWYRARAAARAGDTRTLLRLLGELPPGGYPGRVHLLLYRAADLLDDPGLAERAAALLEPFAAASPDAQALRAALRPGAPPDAPDLLAAFAPVAAGDDPQAAAITQAITSGGPLPGGARSSGPAMRALDTRLAQLAAARREPADLDDEALAAVGLVAERARRAYLDGDGERLGTLATADEAVRHYRALHAFRTAGKVDAAGLRPDAAETVRRTEELAQRFTGRRVAAAEVAADPSTWPFLRANAIDEKITLTERLRSEYPRFAEWLALCATRTSLRDERWDEVAAAAERIAERTEADPILAEALNVGAYARWRLGDAEEALALLDRALATHPVEAHAVNAALVAAGVPAPRGGRAALPYLATVTTLTARPRVRQGAVEHAIALWRATGGGPDYPAVLASMVRAALAEPQEDDEFHRTLLELSLAHDRVWLADAEPVAQSPAQTRTARYHIARAAYAEHPSGDTLRGAAAALVAACRLDPRPDWTGVERERLVDELDRALDAAEHPANPAPAIAVLLAAELFDLRQQLTFAARAGAYLAAAAQARGQMLSAEAERRLVLGPLDVYARRKAELSRRERQAVSTVLAACLRAVATAMVNVAVTRNNTLVALWRGLDGEATPAGPRVLARKAEILDRLDRYLERCHPYLKAMEDLPVDDDFQRQVRDVLARLTAMSTRARRSIA